jgi:hypothetical protein
LTWIKDARTRNAKAGYLFELYSDELPLHLPKRISADAAEARYLDRRMTSIVKIAMMTWLTFVAADRYALGAEPTVITLSCDGKLTNTRVNNAKPQLINKMNLVVNFAERTVSFSGHSAGIDKADIAHISFSSENNAVHGEIDRVTGAAWATTASNAATFAYKLLCKPTTQSGR